MAKLNSIQKRKLISKLIKTDAGRKQLAASMNEPIRLYKNYEAIARRAIVVDPISNGDLPYYDKDVTTNAVVIAEDGKSIRQVVKGVDRVFVPLFEIATNVEIPLTQIAQRRYDLEARVKQRTKIDIFMVEDKKIFGAMIKAITAPNATNPVIPVAVSDINYDTISDAMSLIERHGSNKVQNIFINGKNLTIFRKVLKDLFEPVTVSEIVQSGVVGVFNGAVVNVSMMVPEDTILLSAEPEFVGRLVENIPLTVLNADNPANRMIGFSVFENLGIFLQDHALAGIKLI